MWNNDYKEMLCALRDADVDFILIGAYALAAYGFPRATLDMDLWVHPTPEMPAEFAQPWPILGRP